MENMLDDNTKLIEKFGAERVENGPDFYTFNKDLVYTHRGFDEFMEKLEAGEESAIVSGLNASGTIHIGHKPVFDTNLYFQREYDVPVFIPISDDESYVSKKVDTQEEALKNSYNLAHELLAYGFDPEKTYFIIDQVYTNIYNHAIRLSRKINYSEIKATYGYKPEDNIGLHFYPAIQSAHVLFPELQHDIKNTLVPIGPDEDSHLRISRDIASRLNLQKPKVAHVRFLPGLDGKKMSTSKGNSIFLNDTEEEIEKKVNEAVSGGRKTLEEHREKGGMPEKDMPCQYLKELFYDEQQTQELFEKYRNGDLLTGEVKNKLKTELKSFVNDFQKNKELITKEHLDKAILTNP